MKPDRIFIVRHGQSQGNLDQRTHETVPDYKIPLTPEGATQAQAAGREIASRINGQSIACYVSPYLRTRQTLSALSTEFRQPGYIDRADKRRLDLDLDCRRYLDVADKKDDKIWIPGQVERVREDPRLREQEWGHLRAAEVTDAIDAERQAYGTFFYRIPDGESGADVYDRATGFLATIYRDFEQTWYPKNVLIVTHGFTLRVLLMRWLHWTVEEFHELANPPNCSIFELVRDDTFEGRGRYQISKPFPKKGEIPHAK